jgi:hypothetical protein
MFVVLDVNPRHLHAGSYLQLSYLVVPECTQDTKSSLVPSFGTIRAVSHPWVQLFISACPLELGRINKHIKLPWRSYSGIGRQLNVGNEHS